MSSNSSSDWNDRATPARARRWTDQPSTRASSRDAWPSLRLGEARDDVDQRGLARAVRSDEPDDLARPHLERDAVERDDAAEAHARRPRPAASGHDRLADDRRGAARADAPGGAGCARSATSSRRTSRSSWATTPSGKRIRLRTRRMPDARMMTRSSAPSSSVDRERDAAADRDGAAEQRAADEPDAAEHRLHDDLDRVEHVELREEHRPAAEREQDAAEARDRGRQPERVELGADDADPERRRGALVRAHRDEPAAGASPSEVRDDERGDREHHHAERRVAPPGGRADRGRCRRDSGGLTTVPAKPPV